MFRGRTLEDLESRLLKLTSLFVEHHGILTELPFFGHMNHIPGFIGILGQNDERRACFLAESTDFWPAAPCAFSRSSRGPNLTAPLALSASSPGLGTPAAPDWICADSPQLWDPEHFRDPLAAFGFPN